MLKLLTGLLIGWCLVTTPAVYADTGASDDTGANEDTGAQEDTGATEDDSGSAEDSGSTDTGSSTESTSASGPTYGAAELAGESGSCTTVSAVPAAWMLGCVMLVLVRRRLG